MQPAAAWIDERYELLEKIGEGGLATVHLACDRATGGLVALKLLHPSAGADHLERRFFAREFETLASLDAPGVPRALEQGRIGDLPYFTMEFVDGVGLLEHCRGGMVDWTVSAGLLARAAFRLDAIHRAGIVHRDVKASNILIDRQGRPWWIDFGIGCPIGGPLLPEEHELIVGTLPYIAPERLRSSRTPPDPRADVYSLGVVLYRLLAGFLPFEDEAESALMLRIQYEEPRPAHRARAHSIPRPVSDIAARAMSKRPEDRYPSAREFAGAIGEILIPNLDGMVEADRFVAA